MRIQQGQLTMISFFSGHGRKARSVPRALLWVWGSPNRATQATTGHGVNILGIRDHFDSQSYCENIHREYICSNNVSLGHFVLEFTGKL